MNIPLDLFEISISEKKIYYFSTVEINTDKPHYFICVKKIKIDNKDCFILCCCTSQDSKTNSRIKQGIYEANTIIYISPNNNPFTEPTFVNCNKIIIKSLDEFKKMYENLKLEYKGEVADKHYEQIINGILESDLVDEEIKELINIC